MWYLLLAVFNEADNQLTIVVSRLDSSQSVPMLASRLRGVPRPHIRPNADKVSDPGRRRSLVFLGAGGTSAALALAGWQLGLGDLALRLLGWEAPAPKAEVNFAQLLQQGQYKLAFESRLKKAISLQYDCNFWAQVNKWYFNSNTFNSVPETKVIVAPDGRQLHTPTENQIASFFLFSAEGGVNLQLVEYFNPVKQAITHEQFKIEFAKMADLNDNLRRGLPINDIDQTVSFLSRALNECPPAEKWHPGVMPGSITSNVLRTEGNNQYNSHFTALSMGTVEINNNY